MRQLTAHSQNVSTLTFFDDKFELLFVALRRPRVSVLTPLPQ
jgi:hypothetical protein